MTYGRFMKTHAYRAREKKKEVIKSFFLCLSLLEIKLYSMNDGLMVGVVAVVLGCVSC